MSRKVEVDTLTIKEDYDGNAQSGESTEPPWEVCAWWEEIGWAKWGWIRCQSINQWLWL
jgi:hypothetical protein